MNNNEVSHKWMILIVIANLFVVFLGIGLVIPVMPAMKKLMGLSGSTMGLLVAIFAIAQLICSPIAGRLSDKHGRKKMIAIGMLLFAISEVIFGLAEDVSILYFSRALGGVSAALIMPSVMAFVADMTSIEERPKAMGWVSGAISGGFIIGPGIGGFLGNISVRLPFYSAGALGFLGFLLAVFLLKEPVKEHHHDSQQPTPSLLQTLFDPVLFFPFIIILINAFGLAAFESMYGIYVDLNFGFTMNDIAMVVTGSGVLALIAQVVFFDQLVQRFGEIGLIRLCLILSVLFVVAIVITTNYWVVVGATFVIFLAFDLLRPAITTFLSKNAGNHQGAVSGLNSALTSVGNIVGPLLSGTLIDLNPHYPYYTVVFILSITLVLTLFWKKEKTRG